MRAALRRLALATMGGCVMVQAPARHAVATPETLPPNTVRLHYFRPDHRYAGWGLHVWEDVETPTDWTAPLPPSGHDAYGVYWDVRVRDAARRIGFIVHRGDDKDVAADRFLVPAEHGASVWLVSEDPTLHTQPPDTTALRWDPFRQARAHWVRRDRIVWPGLDAAATRFVLLGAPEGGLRPGPADETGGAFHELVPAAGLPPELAARFPHLRGAPVLALPEAAVRDAPVWLHGQVGVAAYAADGTLIDATALQTAGLLDDLFATDAPLGLEWDGDIPALAMWAPTARVVRLRLEARAGEDAPEARAALAPGAAWDPDTHELVLPMQEAQGVWQVRGTPAWRWRTYRYEVEVFVRATGRVETHRVTDPYARALTVNSGRSQIVDLDDPRTQPPAWSALAKPALDHVGDAVVYELHVRDFSASDPEVPEVLRGTYLAFEVDSHGTRHLRRLAAAGVTHVHLLPTFDIATIEEDRRAQEDPGDLSGFPPDSEEPQARIARVARRDAYNWGYDPLHYGVPEGSYATLPEREVPEPPPGAASSGRIVEFRRMVAALADLGLRVVLDVVYNHTHASGTDPLAVLDRIVPGYYHRLDADGDVATSTCCANTASENAMMERLILDDLVHWVRDYKVDGFRFDLMGHHMKRNMLRFRDALRALTLERDGVDGSRLLLYGEGWDFGEVAGGARGTNATQVNMAGSRVGTFNDRLRDAVRGGNPFGDRREQGFVTGLFLEPNAYHRTAGRDDRAALLEAMDRIRVGLAGNLRTYRWRSRTGALLDGGQLAYGGYALDPLDTVNYVSAHDNETLFDKILLATPENMPLDDRIRMQQLALGLVALGQGIPFFHAGSEILRSKSFDADSYDSGDWFNRLDYTYASNNFGVGLPPAEKNRDRWPLMRPLLARADLVPRPDQIRGCLAAFERFVRIRRSSPLFRLRRADDIQQRVRFHNTGPEQQPGLLVMSLWDNVEGLPALDPHFRRLFVLFNAAPEPRTFRHHRLRGATLVLHPVQAAAADDPAGEARFDRAAGAFTVPARTVAVFVEPRAAR